MSKFVNRNELKDYEWDHVSKKWHRPRIERDLMKAYSLRNSIIGLRRVALLFTLLACFLMLTIITASRWAYVSLIPLYIYYFFFGFLVALAHELQHKTVFAKKHDTLSEILFYFVQTLIWNGPVHARISHRLHHRYTMIKGFDPETNWPDVFTSSWIRRKMIELVSKIFIIGALIEVCKDILKLVKRSLGIKDDMMTKFCSKDECRKIQVESLIILAIHFGIIIYTIVSGNWLVFFLITIAWQVGSGFESIWHSTEHIGKIYNVNDQVLCTRSVKVGPLLKQIYFGLDDHIEHHIYPAIPSYQLPHIHKLLEQSQDEPIGVFACWKEMLRIGREKDKSVDNEWVPYVIWTKLNK